MESSKDISLRIDGQRIYLRDHISNDLDAFHSWLSDPVVTQYLTWRTFNREESLIRLAEALQENEVFPRIKYFFAIVRKENDVIIGEAGFTITSKAEYGGIADLGYFLLKSYWGLGYASEAVRLMIDYCFNILNLHKIIASCESENAASLKVMEKCGMQQEAYRTKHAFRDGQWHDRLEYALLYEEWLQM